MSEKANSWSREAGFIWSMIGSAVGFANILSFSALCYKNGGGAFLVPYLVAHLFIGIPMLMLEASIGQKTKLPLVSAIGSFFSSKLSKTLGWFSILTCASIGGFYVVLTGFSIIYSYFSISGFPKDTKAFFKEHFLHDSGSLTTWGGVAPLVLLGTLLVCVITWVILRKNIRKGVEKICTLFMPLLGVLVLLFACVTLFLPGASTGFMHYLVPDFGRLKEWELWRDVFGQVFFSLSLGLGIVPGYSRHNKDHFNLFSSMIKVALGDFIISFIAGFAIFGSIGYMSLQSGIPFSEWVKTDSSFEMGFVIFPLILSYLGPLFSSLIGPLFFFCIFIAGITGVFSIVESVAGNIETEFNRSRRSAVGWAMALIFTLSLFFCFGNGQHLLGAIAPMLLGNAMLLGGIVEILLFLFLTKKILPLTNLYSALSLKVFVFPLLAFSLGSALLKEWSTPNFEVSLRFGWAAFALLLSSLLARKVREKGSAVAPHIQ